MRWDRTSRADGSPARLIIDRRAVPARRHPRGRRRHVLRDLDPTGLVVFPAGIGGTFAVTSKAAYFLAITSGDGAGRFFADFARTVRPIDQPQRRWQPTGP
ncbi:MAG TPA: hypothetical protein VIT65_16130 [Microlunatus sp.]